MVTLNAKTAAVKDIALKRDCVCVRACVRACVTYNIYIYIYTYIYIYIK